MRGGAERNLLHFAAWQQRAGAEVHLAVGCDSDISNVPGDLPVHVLPHLVRNVDPVADLLALLELRCVVRSGRYDIVHTHQSKAGVLGRLAARGGGRRLVHTVHMMSFGPGYGRLQGAAFRTAERFCAEFTDVIVCVGEDLKREYLRAAVGREPQFMVIHSPIDVAGFVAVRDMPAGERLRRRAQHELDSRPVLLAIGSLEKRKRVSLLIQALAPLLVSGATLLVAGDGAERRNLERQASMNGLAGRVRFLGHVADVAGVMALADVLVHGATTEGVSQVVIQALAAGLPVVATEAPGLREIPGAPVLIVPQDGGGLLDAVRTALIEPATPPPLEALRPWLPEEVERQIAALHWRLVAKQH